MNVFWKNFDRLLDIMAAMAGVILVFICAAVCYTIGMRYVFNSTTIWIMQTTEYALLWIVFLATTRLLRDGEHIITDIIHSHIHEKTRRYLDCVMFVVGGSSCMIMFYFSSSYMYECIVNNVTDVRAVTIPKWTVFSIIPLGSMLLAIQFFRMAFNRFAGTKAEG